MFFLERGYPEKLIQTTLLEVKFALQPKQKENNKTNLAFCYNISTISSKPKTNSHERMASNRKTTITERTLQESALYFIQKRAVAQRYTSEPLNYEKGYNTC